MVDYKFQSLYFKSKMVINSAFGMLVKTRKEIQIFKTIFDFKEMMKN